MLSGSRYSFLNLIVEATLVINGAALIFLCIAAFKRSSRIALIGAIIFSISWIVSFATDVVVIPAFLGYSESEPTALAQVVLSIAGGVLLAASATGRPKTALRIAAAIAFALLLITKIFVNVESFADFVYWSDPTFEVVIECIRRATWYFLGPIGLMLLPLALPSSSVKAPATFVMQTPVQAQTPASSIVTAEDMQRYAQLATEGVLTDEEFAVIKRQYLNS